MTPADFRTALPEFANTISFTDSMLNYWLTLAPKLLNQSRWGNLYDHGIQNFVAHNVVLEALAKKTADVGGVPGLTKGAISSESPGSVSVSYDTGAVTIEGAAHWNETLYGRRFMLLVKTVGMGPISIGPSGAGDGSTTVGSGSAWTGPNVSPGWLGS